MNKPHCSKILMLAVSVFCLANVYARAEDPVRGVKIGDVAPDWKASRPEQTTRSIHWRI